MKNVKFRGKRRIPRKKFRGSNSTKNSNSAAFRGPRKTVGPNNVCMWDLVGMYECMYVLYYVLLPIASHFLKCLSSLYRIRVLGLGLLHPGNKWSQGHSVENVTFSNYFHLISVPAINIHP